MNKHYEVSITAYATVVVVDAESPEKAREYAHDAISRGDFQIDETEVKREIPADELERFKKTADCVAEP